MKTRTLAILSLSAAVLVGGVALAATSQAESRHGNAGYGWQERGHQGGMMGRGMMGGGMMGRGMMGYGMMGGNMETFMSAYDKDGDGKLTQAEVNAGRTARLGTFDANGDGKLTLDEYKALWLDAMHTRMVDRFQFLDEDGDGAVTVAEFTKPYSTLVRHMDRSGDGAVSPKDMKALHERMHGDRYGDDKDSRDND
ncbi:MAG: EF-hand domain-containing protein [Kiloniellaceae bacterium]